MNRLVSPAFSSATLPLSRCLFFVLSLECPQNAYTHVRAFQREGGKKNKSRSLLGFLKRVILPSLSLCLPWAVNYEAESYLYILCLCYWSSCKPDVHLWTLPLNCFSSPCPTPSICIAFVTWVNPKAPGCPVSACCYIQRIDKSEAIKMNLKLYLGLSKNTEGDPTHNSQDHFLNSPLSHSFHSLFLTAPQMFPHFSSLSDSFIPHPHLQPVST